MAHNYVQLFFITKKTCFVSKIPLKVKVKNLSEEYHRKRKVESPINRTLLITQSLPPPLTCFTGINDVKFLVMYTYLVSSLRLLCDALSQPNLVKSAKWLESIFGILLKLKSKTSTSLRPLNWFRFNSFNWFPWRSRVFNFLKITCRNLFFNGVHWRTLIVGTLQLGAYSNCRLLCEAVIVFHLKRFQRMHPLVYQWDYGRPDSV